MLNERFKGENEEYTIGPIVQEAEKENRIGATNFFLTYETVSTDVFRSSINIRTGLELSDDQELVEFYLIPAYPSGTRQDFNVTITVKRQFLFISLTFTRLKIQLAIITFSCYSFDFLSLLYTLYHHLLDKTSNVHYERLILKLKLLKSKTSCKMYKKSKLKCRCRLINFFQNA